MKATQKILIAEDNGLIGEHLAKYIQKQGIQVIDTVGTLTQTKAILEHKRPDIILINIKLLDDKVTAPFIQYLKLICDIPIVILTGYTRKMVPNEIFGFEQVYFLQKPFSNYQLKAVLQNALNLQL